MTSTSSVGPALALVGMVVVSYFSMVMFLGSSSLNLYGGTVDLADYEAQRTTGIVAIVVLVALIVVAGASAVKGGTGARVTAGFAIVLGIACVGWFGLLTWATQESIDELTPAPPAAAEPTCGPDYHPPFFGPGDTLRACPADAQVALAAAQQVVDALVGSEPTVDALRRALSDAGLENLQVQGDDGTSVEAIWGAAPITCAIVTGDSTGWHASATELFADGGCSRRPAGTD